MQKLSAKTECHSCECVIEHRNTRLWMLEPVAVAVVSLLTPQIRGDSSAVTIIVCIVSSACISLVASVFGDPFYSSCIVALSYLAE